MNTLLTPEEQGQFETYNSDGASVGTYQTGLDTQGMLQAQDAKTRKAIVEWLREHGAIEQLPYRDGGGEIFIISGDVWQSLRQAAGLEKSCQGG